ncbi:MAG: C39 family peptidase [Chloroflexota bacterium]|nr:C39 family peptidase [Chloroflexota bacterium]
MQAIRVDRRRTPDLRWLHHLALLSALGFLFVWVVGGRTPETAQLAEQFPSRFLAPPSAPAQDWMPVRIPVRTTIAPEPVLAQGSHAEAETQRLGATEAAVPVRGTVARWVQAQDKTQLLAAPEPGAAAEAEVPRESYLRVLEAREDWLRVSFGGDGSRRPASTAWIRRGTEAIATVDAPRFVTSTRDVQLWSSEDGGEPLATVPRLATLELADVERNGRVAVRVEAPERPEGQLAWVDWEAVAGSRPPAERGVPWQRPFSPFSSEVRLEVPYRTQLDGSLSAASNCGPTSVGMALEAFGMSVPTAQIRALAMRSMGIRDPFSGTTLESLRDAAENFGLQGLDLKENGRYKRWTLEDVRAHLRAGHPVIPQLRYRLMPGREWLWVRYDHYVIITGFVGDEFIYNDPVTLNGKGEGRMSSQQLLRAWMNSDAPGAAVAIARPVY